MKPCETKNNTTGISVVDSATDMTQSRSKKHDALVAIELAALRTAYPTQARGYSESEVQATNALWANVFAGADLDVLHEAVARYIATDRKGYFPSPGQIAGIVDRVAAERAARHKANSALSSDEANLKKLAEYLEHLEA
jgi:hypothetical protein